MAKPHLALVTPATVLGQSSRTADRPNGYTMPRCVQCAPDGGHLADWELTGIAGLSEDGSHGQASFP